MGLNVKSIGANEKSIGFIVLLHSNQRNNIWFYNGFLILKHNFDFLWGRIVKSFQSFKNTLVLYTTLPGYSRKTPGHGCDDGRDPVTIFLAAP